MAEVGYALIYLSVGILIGAFLGNLAAHQHNDKEKS